MVGTDPERTPCTMANESYMNVLTPVIPVMHYMPCWWNYHVLY
jgi:hypothetical protein